MSDDLETALLGTEPEAGFTPVRRGRQKAQEQDAGPSVAIILSENEEIPPTGLYVGLNGKGYLIRPGERVVVPKGVVDILQNAIMSGPVQDPATKQVVGYRDRMRYPFQLVN